MDPQELEATLLRAFPDADLEIKDLTGTRDHYQARIVSTAFAGKSRIEQHRLVYAALGDAMKGPVHALALQTFTPESWAAKR
ncbi:MAG TPA: BolA family transcriptional regulator [Polyangiaceae bacterium]|jgi:stress-induced morphogen|nr:BolA family transcriptional regulator [Polyangiaceae bacterium]